MRRTRGGRVLTLGGAFAPRAAEAIAKQIFNVDPQINEILLDEDTTTPTLFVDVVASTYAVLGAAYFSVERILHAYLPVGFVIAVGSAHFKTTNYPGVTKLAPPPKIDLHCPVCAKPNDEGYRACWWCETPCNT